MRSRQMPRKKGGNRLRHSNQQHMRPGSQPPLDPFAELAQRLATLPGIGPRQARRIAEHLGRLPQSEIEAFIRSLRSLSESLHRCASCRRMFVPPMLSSAPGEAQPLCHICQDPHRDPAMLMVVARDIDLITIERSGSFRGYYFVLGKLLTFSHLQERATLPLDELNARAQRLPPNGEIILALGMTADAELTAQVVGEALTANLPASIRITTLARGLSTGTEIEYADPHTLSYALRFRFPFQSIVDAETTLPQGDEKEVKEGE